MSGGAPTGAVNFYDGSAFLGSGTLSGGGMDQATFTTSTLSVGGHSVTATYGGSSAFAGSGSSTVTETVSQAMTTAAVGLGSSATTVTAGQPVTLTATVSGMGCPTPTGSVTYFDGTTSLGTATLSSGPNGVQASLTTSTLAVGSHGITAVYGGNTTYASSTSSAVTETVQASSPTASVSLSSNTQTAMAGQSVSFTAIVAPPANGAIPTGSVAFFDGGTPLGTVALSPYMGYAAQAVFTTSTLSVGTHTITAAYGANGTYAGATSSAVA